MFYNSHIIFLTVESLKFPMVTDLTSSSPVWPLTALGIEPHFTIPHSLKLEEMAVANGIIGCVLSDYCWYVLIPSTIARNFAQVLLNKRFIEPDYLFSIFSKF